MRELSEGEELGIKKLDDLLKDMSNEELKALNPKGYGTFNEEKENGILRIHSKTKRS